MIRTTLSRALWLAVVTVLFVAPAGAESSWRELGVVKPELDVGIVVTDLEKSLAFYTGMLGMERGEEMPLSGGGNLVFLSVGDSRVKLLKLPRDPPVHPGGIQKGIGMRLVALLLPDADALAERAAANGFRKPGFMGKPGARVGFANDPDGNQIELIERAGASGTRLVIGLTVGETEASRRFYGEVLGMKELNSGPLFGTSGPIKYNFALDDLAVKFWSFGANKPRHTGPVREAAGIRYMTFMVRDLDAAHAALKERGAKIVSPPRDIPNVARYMFVEDPDGNSIEFAQNMRPGR